MQTTNLTISQIKEQLQEQKKVLHSKLSDRTNIKKYISDIHEIDAKIKELNKAILLNQVNTKYFRLRQLALLVYECEQPIEDITSNDGSFHKTKVKKYPKIAALPYASAIWENNRFMTIRVNGEKFSMFKTKYEQGKENEYVRPETFDDFLILNLIPVKEITMQEYNDMCEKLNALNDQLKKDIEIYKEGLKSLNNYSLNCWGLIGEHNVHLYEYTPNS